MRLVFLIRLNCMVYGEQAASTSFLHCFFGT